MRKSLRKKVAAVLMAIAVLLTTVNIDMISHAKGNEFV